MSILIHSSLDRGMSLTVIPIIRDGATSLISHGKFASENYAPQFHELYHQAYPQFNDQAVYPPSNFHPPHQQ
jgi:hypothetical protein